MSGDRNEANLADQTLVERAQQDPAAFEPFYDRYLDPIYAYCYRRLGTRELAEDATSQVFVQAMAALPRFRAHSFRAWLYTIAHNVVMDVHRAKSPLPLIEDAEIEALAVDGELDWRASELDVRRLLAQLTDDQRDVVELRLSGMTGPEIAEILGRSPGAVRALQFRAYQHLRALLAPNEVTQ
ncbi:MAG: sigma-70 family RNA polymerase sigma factor [Thermomicrobiales bacterium]|nr:sigma-70 family RNA polymerase sigma factor [Thermomicrobiales bacterium]